MTDLLKKIYSTKAFSFNEQAMVFLVILDIITKEVKQRAFQIDYFIMLVLIASFLISVLKILL